MTFRTDDGDRDKFDHSLHHYPVKKFDQSLHYYPQKIIHPEQKYYETKRLECNSIHLNGTSSYINCGNNATVQLTNPITILAQIIPSKIISSFIVSKYQGANNRYEIFLNPSYFLSIYGDGITSKSAKYTMTPVINTCYNIVSTIDNSGVIKIYVNTVEGELSETLPNPVANITGDLKIGVRGASYYNGSINKLLIYNRILSTNEISAFSKNNSISLNNLALDLPITSDYSTKNIIKDESGNANHGTLTDCEWNCDWIRENHKVI